MSLVRLLCPLRRIGTPWKPRELQGGETDGHSLCLRPGASVPCSNESLRRPSKSARKMLVFTEHALATPGNSRATGLKVGSQRQNGRQTDRQHARGGRDKTAVS